MDNMNDIILLKNDSNNSTWSELDLTSPKVDLTSCIEKNPQDVIQHNIKELINRLENKGEISDGYHTFNELYHHRAVLFALICNQNQGRAWKSLLHSNPEDKMYDGMFIVGIDTPFGQVTYHYDIDPYWNVFHVKELERAPEWDGHTPQEAIDRLQKWSDTFTLKTKIDLGGKR